MARTQVQTELIATNAISGTIIADNAITAVHIATNSISGVLVQDSGITTTMIAANNVTAAKIVSDGIETRHLHSNVVSGLSAVTAASGDYVLLGDTSDSNNLKKALVSDLGNSLANNTNNYVVTATGSGLNGESNLTFDGSTLGLTGAATISSTLGVTGVTTLASHLVLGDDDEIRLGDSTDITLKHHNSGYGHLQNTGTLYVDAEVLSFRTDNSGIGERLNINAAGLAAFSGAATIAGTLGVTGVLTPNRINAQEHIIMQTSGKYFQVTGSGGTAWAIGSTGGNNTPGTGAVPLAFHNWDGSAWNNEVEFGADGTITLDGNVIIGSTGKLYSSGDTDSYLQFNQADTLRAVIGDSTRMIINTGETVFNEDSGDFDFRVESNGSTHMFQVDAGTNKIVMSANPADDTQATPHDILTLAVPYANAGGTNGAAGLGPAILFKVPDDETNPSVGGRISVVRSAADDSDSSSDMVFETSQNDETLDEAMRIAANGDVSFDSFSYSKASDQMTINNGLFLSSGYIRSGAADFSLGTASNGAMFTLDNSSNRVWAAGHVMQVVQATGGAEIMVSGTFNETGLDASITPLKTSSKVLVTVTSSATYNNGTAGLGIAIFRGATEVCHHVIAGSSGNQYFPVSMSFLDSPNTTSATTYYVKHRSENGSSLVGFCTTGVDGDDVGYLQLMEIGA